MTKLNNVHNNFIGGEFVSYSGAAIQILNPATGLIIGEAPNSDAATVASAVAAAVDAQTAWQALPGIERAVYLRKVSALLRTRAPELAAIITLEQGKVTPLAQTEVFLAAEYLDYMAEWARRIEGEIVSSDRANENIFIFRRALGVVAGVLPWNFPFFMYARKMAPALITGNTIVIKPSEETPLSANAFSQIVSEAGVPAGVVNVVYGGGASTGAALTAHAGIDMISFTGSTAAGSKIYAQGAANVTKVSLELGGKAPVIVMDDADIDLAVAILRGSKTVNTGQACHCPERVYVHRKVADKFTDKLASAMSQIRYGDANGGDEVEMGPLINRAAVNKIKSLVDDATTKGASLITGGRAADQSGCHYQPTVLRGTRADMQISQQEVFGPVLVVDTIDSLDEGIARANDSDYGLSSSIFTNNLHAALKACRELKAGETYVNRENFEAIQGFHAGVKKSGIGGTDGKHGLYEYMATQVVYM